jgi:hypothetical protein
LCYLNKSDFPATSYLGQTLWLIFPQHQWRRKKVLLDCYLESKSSCEQKCEFEKKNDVGQAKENSGGLSLKTFYSCN